MSAEQFAIDSRRRYHHAAAKIILKRHQRKLDALDNLIDAQSQLLGEYLRADIVQAHFRIGPDPNPVLPNAISNALNISLASTDLLRTGHFGAVRALMRQMFEMQVTAKVSVADKAVQQAWEGRPQKAGRHGQVQIRRDVLDKRWPPTGGIVSPLHSHWAELNDFLHHTRFAGQTPLVSDNSEGAEGRAATRYLIAETELSIDLLVCQLAFNAHLLTPHYRRRLRGFFATHGVIDKIARTESTLRARQKKLLRDYWNG